MNLRSPKWMSFVEHVLHHMEPIANHSIKNDRLANSAKDNLEKTVKNHSIPSFSPSAGDRYIIPRCADPFYSYDSIHNFGEKLTGVNRLIHELAVKSKNKIARLRSVTITTPYKPQRHQFVHS